MNLPKEEGPGVVQGPTVKATLSHSLMTCAHQARTSGRGFFGVWPGDRVDKPRKF